jgi:hypothetical protein
MAKAAAGILLIAPSVSSRQHWAQRSASDLFDVPQSGHATNWSIPLPIGPAHTP